MANTRSISNATALRDENVLRRVRHLGSARDGLAEWRLQRRTALALIPLLGAVGVGTRGWVMDSLEPPSQVSATATATVNAPGSDVTDLPTPTDVAAEDTTTQTAATPTTTDSGCSTAGSSRT